MSEVERIDKFDAKDRLGHCPDADRPHIEEDLVDSLDGERYLCFWCDKEVSAYVGTSGENVEGDR